MGPVASWLERATTSTVVVHTADGRSLRGVLAGVYRDELVLAHASYLTIEGPRELSGEVGVPREMVAFVQRLDGAAP
jgi:hypothetical protein